MSTHLVELIAEVDRVDIVAFQVGEHDDLHQDVSAYLCTRTKTETDEEDHREKETSRKEHGEQK